MKQIIFLLIIASEIVSAGPHGLQSDSIEDKSGPCQVLLLRILGIDEAEWKRLSVRDPSDQLLDEGYLKRLRVSMEKAFVPWFESSEPMGDIPFREMLRLQHVFLVTGESGNERYNGATLPLHGFSGPPIPEGQFRFERTDIPASGHIMTFRIETKLPERSRHLQSQIKWYSQHPTASKPTEPTDTFPIPFSHPEAVVDLVRLPRLGDDVKIRNEIFSHYVTHHYPSQSDVPKILKAMETVMSDMRTLTHQSGKLSRPALIELLSEYIYLGIHSHLFEAGNFSMCMAQVNYILEKNGLRGISHGNLDYVGLSEHFESFKDVFRRMLAKVNPNEEFLKTPHNQPDEKPILNITAHLANHGDAYFREGGIIQTQGRFNPIEGIYVAPPDLGDGVVLEYQGRIQQQGDSDWVRAGTYLGTSGQARSLEGVAFRLTGPRAGDFEVTYKVRVSDREWTLLCKNGEYCGTKGKGLPITALRIEVKKL